MLCFVPAVISRGVEGPGEMGRPVIIPKESQEKMKELFKINQFNLMASDSIALNRSLPDVRLDGSVGPQSHAKSHQTVELSNRQITPNRQTAKSRQTVKLSNYQTAKSRQTAKSGQIAKPPSHAKLPNRKVLLNRQTAKSCQNEPPSHAKPPGKTQSYQGRSWPC